MRIKCKFFLSLIFFQPLIRVSNFSKSIMSIVRLHKMKTESIKKIRKKQQSPVQGYRKDYKIFIKQSRNLKNHRL